MTTHKVLVVDDEPDIRELLQLTLTRMGLSCDIAASFEEGRVFLDSQDYFLVLTDMRLPGKDGSDLVKYIQKNNPTLPVAVITAFGNVEEAVSTLKAGAFDYVTKPVDLNVLKALVNTALKMDKKTSNEHVALLLGESNVINALRENIKKVARSQAPVYIQGQSGVGKELVARLIHASGPRASKPFIPVNCGAIPSELMESEFFGHKKGSFTGAYADKQGLFLAAVGGTLFLDEVAELPLAMQVKLLRAIQEKAVKPVGEWSEVPVDVRILSASNKNLTEEIARGRFREELYYRINVIELQVPTLQERSGDIPLLAANILKKLAMDQNKTPSTLHPSCISALEAYSFPGNVRELENILERAMALSSGNEIHVADLKLPSNPLEMKPTEREINFHLDSNLEEHEKALIMKALEKTKWNRTAAARLLGVSFRTLRYRLKKLGIE
jgi:two-component system, NtrC family, response regulator PilR